MGRVVQDVAADEIMQYVYEQYDKWIQKCVAPRDVIIHYDDIKVIYTKHNEMIFPNFIYKKDGESCCFYLAEVIVYVISFYDFVRNVLQKVEKKIS